MTTLIFILPRIKMAGDSEQGYSSKAWKGIEIKIF